MGEQSVCSVVETQWSSVYGPVQSWRYGRSLGVDPIGLTSACSFDCVYCQLGDIEKSACDRKIFVPTQRVLTDLEAFIPWDVDVITISGSGEPTLALNLGELITVLKRVTHRPVGVLTNGSLLTDRTVQDELAIANAVSVKVDAVSPQQFRGVNRPMPSLHLGEIWVGIEEFRHRFSKQFAIQTMLLCPWSDRDQTRYINLIQRLHPDEIQLNTPTRPRPMQHQLDARGNHDTHPNYPVQWLRAVEPAVMRAFGDRIHQETGVPVRYPAVLEFTTQPNGRTS